MIKNQLKFEKIELIDKVNESGNIYTFKFKIPDGFTWKEGAHMHLALKDFMDKGTPDKSKVRTLSIMSVEEEGYVGITTRIINNSSDYKKKLLQLEPGDEMIYFKVGNRMELKRNNKPIILLSMGVGMATCRPLIINYLKNSESIKALININVSREEMLYNNEFNKVNHKGFINHYVTSKDKLYEEINSCINTYEGIYYVVGSDTFLKDICSYLILNKIKVEDIIIDKNNKKREEFINNISL